MNNRIRQLAERMGLSLRAFSNRCGIRTSILENQARGICPISAESVEAITKTFPYVSEKWLLSGDGDMFSSNEYKCAIDIPIALKAFFKKKGMTQVDVAEKIGTTKASVNKYFLGYNKFGKVQAEKWHELFGISKSFLLTGEGSIVDEEPAKQIEGLQQTISDLNSAITEMNKAISNIKVCIEEIETKLNINH